MAPGYSTRIVRGMHARSRTIPATSRANNEREPTSGLTPFPFRNASILASSRSNGADKSVGGGAQRKCEGDWAGVTKVTDIGPATGRQCRRGLDAVGLSHAGIQEGATESSDGGIGQCTKSPGGNGCADGCFRNITCRFVARLREAAADVQIARDHGESVDRGDGGAADSRAERRPIAPVPFGDVDRKSTRLNSS